MGQELEFEKKMKLKEMFILKKGPLLINRCLVTLSLKLQEKEAKEMLFSNIKELSLGFVLNLLDIQKSCLYLKALLEDVDPIKKWKQVTIYFFQYLKNTC